MSRFAWIGVALVAMGAGLMSGSASRVKAQEETPPTYDELLAQTPSIHIDQEHAEDLSFVAELPSPLLERVVFEVSVIDSVQSIGIRSVQGAPIGIFVDGQGVTYDCIGPKVTYIDGIWVSLEGRVTEDRVYFGFGLSPPENVKIAFDPAAFLKIARDPVIESLGDHRYRLQMTSPSGSSQVVAIYDGSREHWFESMELVADATDESMSKVMFRLYDVRHAEEARSISSRMPVRSDIPESIDVNEVSATSFVGAGLQVMHLIRLTGARIGLENPELRSLPAMKTIVGELNWERMQTADAQALELLRPLFDGPSTVRTGAANDAEIR